MLEIAYQTWTLGGPILVPIFIVGFLGFFLVLQTYADLGTGLWKVNFIHRFDAIRASLATGRDREAREEAEKLPGIVKYGVVLALENRGLPASALRHLLDEKLSYALYHLERHLPLIRGMAASAPLLGLLGTVSGLIHTFQTMTEYGSSSTQLLAAGISEALIAAQTGLLIAIILILLGQRLEGRVQWLQQQVEYGLTVLLNANESESNGLRPDLSPERHA